MRFESPLDHKIQSFGQLTVKRAQRFQSVVTGEYKGVWVAVAEC